MILNFDAASVSPYIPNSGGGTTYFPHDDYPVEIVSAEIEAVNNKQQNKKLVVTYKVIEGEFAGSTQKENLNIINENATSVRIAYARLSSIARIINRKHLSDEKQLIGGRLIIEIGPQKDKQGMPSDKYSEVYAYKDAALRLNGEGEPHPATPVDNTSFPAVNWATQPSAEPPPTVVTQAWVSGGLKAQQPPQEQPQVVATPGPMPAWMKKG